jgi:hypothetical protein
MNGRPINCCTRCSRGRSTIPKRTRSRLATTMGGSRMRNDRPISRRQRTKSPLVDKTWPRGSSAGNRGPSKEVVVEGLLMKRTTTKNLKDQMRRMWKIVWMARTATTRTLMGTRTLRTTSIAAQLQLESRGARMPGARSRTRRPMVVALNRIVLIIGTKIMMMIEKETGTTAATASSTPG